MPKYDWAVHIKRMCGLFTKSGAGFDGRFVASDSHGDYANFWEPHAIRFSLYGANVRVMADWWLAHPDLLRNDSLDINARRRQTMMSLFIKAGMPSKRRDILGMIEYEQNAKWSGVEILLRNAYILAKKAQQ